MGFFVMPRLIGGANFHRGNDMHQSGMVAALGDHIGDKVFFTDVRLVDVLYGYPLFFRNLLGALAYVLAQRLGKYFGVIEYSDATGIQETRHAARVTGTW